MTNQHHNKKKNKLPKKLASMNPEQLKKCYQNFQNTCQLHNNFQNIIGTRKKNTESGKVLSNLVGNVVGT